MTDRTGIFQGDDPFVLVQEWLAEARKTELNDPDAVAMASVDETGMPNVRIVLLRGLESDAFVFFSNYESAKGVELLQSGKAAFVIHWKSLRRQIRVRGVVEKEDGAVADSYYDGRPLGSKIGAWASKQSRPLENRQVLIDAVKAQENNHADAPKRPPYWGGFRIFPTEIEFWADGEFRLHDRFQWRRKTPNDPWIVQRLNP